MFNTSDATPASPVVRVVNSALDSPVGAYLEPYLARLGRNIREIVAAIKIAWIELANGDGTANRMFAIVLGYASAALVVALYLNILNVGSVQSAGRAIRTAIRQQLIVTKARSAIAYQRGQPGSLLMML